jgi:hypothetical protein
MKLNHNSLSARLYRWFYGTNEMPTNLCPYFWKLVAAVVFGIPIGIITLPYIIIYKDKEGISIGEKIGGSLIAYVMLTLAICMLSLIGLFFVTPEKDTAYLNMVCIGIVCWTVGLILGISELIKRIRDKWEDRRYRKMRNEHDLPVKEKQPNLIIEMVKAKYHKYCPQIKWEK